MAERAQLIAGAAIDVMLKNKEEEAEHCAALIGASVDKRFSPFRRRYEPDDSVAKYGDLAFLYRKHVQTVDIELKLTLAHIPYRKLDSQVVFQKEEVRDFFALFSAFVKSKRTVGVLSSGQ